MPYRVCKIIEIESGHMLSKHPSNCKFPHGHSRKVELVLEADDLDHNDMVCDFKVIKMAIQEFADQFDHAMCVNTQDPRYGELKALYGERVIGFDDADPTSEVMVKTIFDRVRQRLQELAGSENMGDRLPRNVRLSKVRSWETSSAWAEYWE